MGQIVILPAMENLENDSFYHDMNVTRIRTIRFRLFLARCVHWLLVGLVVIASAEMSSRVVDRLRYQVPLSATPSFEKDLFVVLPNGEKQGRPNGAYKKFRMNERGFRGPAIIDPPNDTAIRVMLVGSSETFGMYESLDMDYPSQLRGYLSSHGQFQVINTALPGLSAGTAVKRIDQYLTELSPNYVVIYLSPLFELNQLPQSMDASALAKSPSRPSSKSVNPSSVGSRFLDNMKDVIEKPLFIQKWLDERAIASSRKRFGADSVYKTVPLESVENYLKAIEELVSRIRNTGAQPILATHAIAAISTEDSISRRILESFLKNTPRATPRILIEYEEVVRQRVLELGHRENTLVVDVASELNGRHEAFGDLVHFSDKGATRIANLLANAILKSEEEKVAIGK